MFYNAHMRYSEVCHSEVKPKNLKREILRFAQDDKKFIFIFLFFVAIFSSFAFAEENDIDANDPAEKARKAHEMAASDVIYQQQDFKALYYQNQQVIQLLKEIRDTLDAIKARDNAKDPQK